MKAPSNRTPSNRKNLLKIAVISVVMMAIVAFFALDLSQYMQLDYIQQQRAVFAAYYDANRLLVLLGFFLLYVIATALSLPIAAILTLLAGALFGFLLGLVVVSFASSIGASLAFLFSRFIFRDTVQQKYGHYLEKVNQGIKKEGAFYLFALRLVPVVPFFVVNLLMGLMPIRLWVFYVVSQIGMLAGTAVYVYAGTELGQITALSDIMSPTLWIAFVLLGLLPLLSKKILAVMRKRHATNV
ncbi:TVP38/TMEM64 family protein [Ostreibacterium oceani]|uniref:TVP38/TMEM64 family membrane protein n=1 Tax=Ostreibacterium oceani TaxID=2654998 RepID=A0A6N7EW47_9GAMM|nr:VTT domain-containing protein [Ostreibacterium oceani]MPV85780.1 TVP38/TMEM64 family protein [Ostreibacterium oceani]